ncbi:ADP-ribosylation factor [Planoprotostelium fungivorum]|uniref:ADP-ribosylation factor n=1 Tax=Planoprotostelium fungivorum TaxID=1890364 RepID=A0A2P6NQQ6_9EUKA|nr:ADP-ribosylation factor [Planoprotostelium fungivorum]
MGNLFSLYFTKRDYRLVVLGLDGAGKTTALYRLHIGESIVTVPTIGFNVETIEYRNIKLTMWDVGGQDRIRCMWHYYFQGVHGIVYVVDAADRERMYEARDELEKLLDTPQLEGVPLLVLANKMDQPQSLSVKEVVSELGLDQMKWGRTWHVEGTIATEGKGVYEGLDWLIGSMKR